MIYIYFVNVISFILITVQLNVIWNKKYLENIQSIKRIIKKKINWITTVMINWIITVMINWITTAIINWIITTISWLVLLFTSGRPSLNARQFLPLSTQPPHFLILMRTTQEASETFLCHSFIFYLKFITRFCKLFTNMLFVITIVRMYVIVYNYVINEIMQHYCDRCFNVKWVTITIIQNYNELQLQ